jgi:hypothetical protein
MVIPFGLSIGRAAPPSRKIAITVNFSPAVLNGKFFLQVEGCE